MNRFEFFQNVQLTNEGAVEVVAVTGLTDSTITTPGNQKEFFEQIQLDENGAVKVYIKTGPTPAAFFFIASIVGPDCGATTPDLTYYTAGIPILSNGVILYTDNTLSTPVNGPGVNFWFSEIVGGSTLATMSIDSNGEIFDYTLC